MFVLSFVDESHTIGATSNEDAGASTKRTPRPKNAFILYRREKQKAFSSSLKNMHSKDLSRIIGRMWRNESEDVIKSYERLAEEEKLQHFSKYPQYKYAPRQRKKIKSTQNTSLNSEKTTKSKDSVKTVDASTQVNGYDIMRSINLFECEYSDIFDEVLPNVLGSRLENGTENHTGNTSKNSEPTTMICPSTLPSSLVNDTHILPDTSSLDIFTLDEFEFEDVLSTNIN